MPNPNHLLTDRLLAELYLNLARHYESLQRSGRSEAEIYNELYNSIYYSMQGELSSLSRLSPEEQTKAFKVLDIFMEARLGPSNYQHTREAFQQDMQEPKASTVVIHHHYPVYCNHNDDLWLTWMIMDSWNRRTYPCHPDLGRHHHRHHHGHQDNQNEQSNNDNALALIAVIAISAVALGAVYYTVNESLNACERFYHNEGWLQASITLLGGTAGAFLTAALAASPATSLALAAGLSNPAGWAALVLGTLGLAAGFFVTNQIQDRIITHTHAEALDPNDPNRYALSKAEITALEAKNIDPDKVKCAIVALRAEIGEQKLPSFTSRFFGYHTNIQDNLDKIRQLRRGELRQIQVGDMRFSLEKPRTCAYTPFYSGATGQDATAFHQPQPNRYYQPYEFPQYAQNTGIPYPVAPPYVDGSVQQPPRQYAYGTDERFPEPSAPPLGW